MAGPGSERMGKAACQWHEPGLRTSGGWQRAAGWPPCEPGSMGFGAPRRGWQLTPTRPSPPRAVLLVSSNEPDGPGQVNVLLAAANAACVSHAPARHANVYDLVRHSVLLLDSAALADLERRFTHPRAAGHIEPPQYSAS